MADVNIGKKAWVGRNVVVVAVNTAVNRTWLYVPKYNMLHV